MMDRGAALYHGCLSIPENQLFELLLTMQLSFIKARKVFVQIRK